MSLRWKLLALGSGIVVIVVGLGALAAYHDRHGMWPWQDAPDRLSWCGRDYLRGTTRLTWAEASRRVSDGFRVEWVGEPIPSRRPGELFAELPTDRPSGAPPDYAYAAGRASVCTVLLYLRVEEDEYIPYSLSGST
ncbi:hypothetical protein FrEUN1fDRAFT_7818 [Parafrankia sp. EUN1f]|nr:hypothetical protein FrEUN1fDRAFT_7818 [Parafrankia sp. EUN1f]